MTVMDKSIKSSAHVKYPTEKDRPRGAGLNLVASRGTWVSESPISSSGRVRKNAWARGATNMTVVQNSLLQENLSR
jgi:hypothetical protein